MRFGTWTARWQLAGPRRALLFTGLAWLIIAVIVLRFTLASVTTDVLAFLVAAVARGLTEAMRGTLQPAQTPGGGLTMTMSLPAAPRPTRAHLPGCRPRGTGS